uniref:Amino acid transporter transmembrane domain-containing protein n=1 Tax=Aegilops tauschii subsp. strangulata TaxID=200361 RepID=A0A453F135_AEGTS
MDGSPRFSVSVGVFVLMIAVPAVATERASAKFVFTHLNTDNSAGIHNNLYIFVLGLLMSQYTLTGYDASAHMTEETKNADKNGPIGIISAISISIVVGWGYILGITFAVKEIPYLLSPDNEAGGYAIAEVFYLAFKSRYGSGVGGIVCLGIVAVAIYFCGMSSVTSNSRDGVCVLERRGDAAVTRVAQSEQARGAHQRRLALGFRLPLHGVAVAG